MLWRGVLSCAVLSAAYPPLYPNFPLSAMDTPLKYHEQELSYAGIDLKKLLNSGKKVGEPATEEGTHCGLADKRA